MGSVWNINGRLEYDHFIGLCGAMVGCPAARLITNNQTAAGRIWPFFRSMSDAAGTIRPSRLRWTLCAGASYYRSTFSQRLQHILSMAYLRWSRLRIHLRHQSSTKMILCPARVAPVKRSVRQHSSTDAHFLAMALAAIGRHLGRKLWGNHTHSRLHTHRKDG